MRRIEAAGKGPQAGVSIVGLGNWGLSLACALRAAGVLCEVIGSSQSGHSLPRPAQETHGFSVTALERARLDAAVLWLCVPDSSIAHVARRLVRRVAGRPGQLKGQIVVHSSGALSAGILKAAARAGASVASVHPVMTFPTRTPVPVSGVAFGIEAEAPARRKLNAIVRRLGGRPFAVPSSGKALYHAVGMMASPLLVSLIAAAHETAGLAGLSPGQARSLIEPIAQATLTNIFTQGAAESFSGPIARGDAAAIQLHLQALMPHPNVADLYRSLALYALDSLPSRSPEEIRRLLQRSAPKRRTGATSSGLGHEKLEPPDS